MKIISITLIKIIKIYQFFISPFIGNNCRYMPTCSDYFIESLKVHGTIKGFCKGIKRIKLRIWGVQGEAYCKKIPKQLELQGF